MTSFIFIFSVFFGIFNLIWAFSVILKRDDDDDAFDDLGYLEHIEDL